MNFPLPKDVIEIIEAYEKNGFHAHIVGGPVRDFLLGITPHDFDITTDAMPQETKALFDGERIIETGIKHGTVTLLKSNIPYEITTYRIDGEYLDGRHPESVSFTRSLAEDLARRDFTVNAMAYAPSSGVVDLFDGKTDLNHRILRAVGNPTKRFEEDALRILRALRFRSRLGFEIEEETKRSIFSCAPLMRALANERVMNEFTGILCGPHAEEILVEYASVLSVVLPELATSFTEVPLPLVAKRYLPTEEDGNEASQDPETLFFTRLLALAVRAALTPLEYSEICTRMHTSRHLNYDGARILSVLDTSIYTDYDILKLLSSIGEPSTRIALELLIYKGLAPCSAKERLEILLETHRPYRIGDLAVGGKDLLPLGYRGAALGKTLQDLLDATMQGLVENTREALLSYLTN